MQDADRAVGDRRSVAGRVKALAGRLDADEPDALVLHELAEHADRVGAAAHAGDDLIGQPTRHGEHLGARLP